MKLHVKHLKSNKKSIFFLSIILLIPFLKKKKGGKKKGGGKEERSFLDIKTSVSLISTQSVFIISRLSLLIAHQPCSGPTPCEHENNH